jgi:predicted dehydrogenase
MVNDLCGLRQPTIRPILIIGLGSIGRRHFRNLLLLGYDNIVLYRTGKSTLPNDELAGYTTFGDLEEGLASNPVAVIISNPTSLHVSTALKAVRAGCHIFLEKPVSHSLEGISELQRNAEAQKLQVHVGFQFRFHPVLRQMKKWIENNEIGQVVSAQSHWGEYVKSWHPWEDYRSSYSVREELGGGVVLTLSHPFDYLTWFLGDVEKVYAATRKHQSLITNAECIAETVLHFKTGVIGSVYLDYLEHPAKHTVDIIGDLGTIRWNNADGTAKLFVRGRCVSECAVPNGFERNTMFLEEIRHFLKCLNGEALPICSIDDGIKSLKIALAAKRSAAEGREVCV